MVVSPLFWECFNIWLIQFLKNLYHEIKMVGLRGGNSSYGSVGHGPGCGYRAQHASLEMPQNVQTTFNISHVVPHSTMSHLIGPNNPMSHATYVNANHGHNGHVNAHITNHGSHDHLSHAKNLLKNAHTNQSTATNHISLSNQSNNSVNSSIHIGHLSHASVTGSHSSQLGMQGHSKMQFMQQQAQVKQEQCRHSSSSRAPQSSQYRVAQTMPIPGTLAECYHQGGTGPAYLGGGTTPNAQTPVQSMRTQSAPQPSAPPPPEMTKTTMAGHNYVTPPNATPPARHQYANFQYRGAQHTTRPNTHARQQQPFIPGGGGSAGGPVVYHQLLFPPHIPIPQSYQQPRSSSPGGYYPYMPYIYPTPTGHTTPYFFPNGQQVGGNNGGRSNPGPLVPQPAAPAPPALPAQHMQLPGIRQGPAKRTSRRLAIINPLTKQDIFSEESFSNDSQNASAESSEPEAPQPQNNALSIVAQFTRMVNEVANQPSNNSIKLSYTKANQVPAVVATNTQPQANAINSTINYKKSDLLNDKMSPEPEVIETPIVSAISDSPVIVPKTTNVKQQKISDQSQSIDNKVQMKPNVPQNEVQADVVLTQDAVVVGSPLPSSPQLQQPQPQPQRVREPRDRSKVDEKEKEKEKEKEDVQEKDVPKLNGPIAVVISSADSTSESIIPPTSQNSNVNATKTPKQNESKQIKPTIETEPLPNVIKAEVIEINKSTFPEIQAPTATQLLSSIEKIAKEEYPTEVAAPVKADSASPAQAKLTQSIVSAARNNTDTIMKDINLNNTNLDAETANGNMTDVAEPGKDVNKNEKAIKNSKNNSKKLKNATLETGSQDVETYENGKDETDKVSNVEQEQLELEDVLSEKEEQEANAPTVFVPKYKYDDDQWSPLNTSGKKCYDIRLLMQIKDDPLCKNKPNVAALLESLNVLRPTPIQDSVMSFNQISRPVNDSLFPNFLKNTNVGMRSTLPRDAKKEGRNAVPTGKGSMKLSSSSSGSGAHKNVIVVSLSLREEVKLNQSKDAWKPSRFKKENLNEEELKTQDLYKKFRGILNKLTPQKFETLIDRVKSLEINTQDRLEGVIDLVFEKAVDEPNFSEAYAAMCSKLSTIRVPAANAPDQCVNFHALIVTRCQNQFVTEKVEEQVIKLEKEVAECNDPAKKKELLLMLDEENRRGRMRSVGNVRFIGELYKLKMLTAKIMVFCMDFLVNKLEEEKLECLCKLLTTIGEQVESDVKDQVEAIFKNMQKLVERKSNKISSRVRFMIQDVIELRRRKWVIKNVVDSQPKMMDQIQKEAEQQQRNIELMNSSPMGGFRREEGGRGKRGDGGRRQGGANSFMDNNWKTTTRNSYTVDTTKLKAASVSQKNLSSIKLGPPSAWGQGSSTKTNTQSASNSMISLNKNKYSILANTQADPTSLTEDLTPAAYTHSKSIERSTFNSRGDFNTSGAAAGRSGSTGPTRSDSGTRTPPPTPSPPVTLSQEAITEKIKKMVRACLNNDFNKLVEEIKLIGSHHHAAIITEIFNVFLDKNVKEIALLSKAVMHVISSGTISMENLLAGMSEIFEYAPDLFIDIPMLYVYISMLVTPHVEKKNITLKQVLQLCETIISSKHGHLMLQAIIKDLKDSMGPTFTRSKWTESGLEFKQWMAEEMVPKWIEDNKFEFLEGNTEFEDTKKIMTPNETQGKLLQLMNSDESCDCLRGWVKDKIGASTCEEWFMRCLTQAICEHSLFGPERSPFPHFSHDRMNKYSPLIGEYGESRAKREAACLFGIQQLIHKLEHPQGLTLDIFQYLHEQYIISVEGFIAWEVSEMEPEGKAVMLKALTSFFTSIREADNEDSCSEA